jgi:cytoskeletal protein RodZ
MEVENMENCDVSEKDHRLRILLRRYYDQSITDSESEESIREVRIQRRRQRSGLKFWQFCLIYLGIIGLFIGIAFLLMEGHILILKSQRKSPLPTPKGNSTFSENLLF